MIGRRSSLLKPGCPSMGIQMSQPLFMGLLHCCSRWKYFRIERKCPGETCCATPGELCKDESIQDIHLKSALKNVELRVCCSRSCLRPILKLRTNGKNASEK
ncbi:hypothetical protein CEXT_424871 [Caerostris extrusa]|uniref:Uncharacterized protein n=1 Tax=Caerostris extrusa TaxID=172846 RepID=A0AAV4MFH1_CAEEX|nr:hypothetical protein CEXT_424871 [Caerostris extrusa]